MHGQLTALYVHKATWDPIPGAKAKGTSYMLRIVIIIDVPNQVKTNPAKVFTKIILLPYSTRQLGRNNKMN